MQLVKKTVADRHTELQIAKKKQWQKQRKRGAISEKPVAGLSNELQMVKNSGRHDKDK